MDTTVSVTHKITSVFAFDDQNGSPMLTPVTPDKMPEWTTSDPSGAVATMTVSPDGATVVWKAVAPGMFTGTLSVVVGGVTMKASFTGTVTAEGQVPTSVRIVNTVE